MIDPHYSDFDSMSRFESPKIPKEKVRKPFISGITLF